MARYRALVEFEFEADSLRQAAEKVEGSAQAAKTSSYGSAVVGYDATASVRHIRELRVTVADDLPKED